MSSPKDGQRACDKPVIHRNVESLSRYIQKHDEYSNWEARVPAASWREDVELPPSLGARKRSADAGLSASSLRCRALRFCSSSIVMFSAWVFWTACQV